MTTARTRASRVTGFRVDMLHVLSEGAGRGYAPVFLAARRKMERRMKHHDLSDDAIPKILESARTIAMIGALSMPDRATAGGLTVIMDRCLGQTVRAMGIAVAGR